MNSRSSRAAGVDAVSSSTMGAVTSLRREEISRLYLILLSPVAVCDGFSAVSAQPRNRISLGCQLQPLEAATSG